MKKCWYNNAVKSVYVDQQVLENRTERQSHCLKETGLGKPHLYVDSGDGVQLMPLESK